MIHAADVMGGAVVGGEDDKGVFLQTLLLQFHQKLADVVVHEGNHGGVARAWARVGLVGTFAAVGFGVPFLRVALDPIARRLHRHVRFERTVIDEEGLFRPGLPIYIGEQLIGDGDGRVFLAGELFVGNGAFGDSRMAGDAGIVDRLFHAVAPQEGRVERVAHPVVGVAVEIVHAVAVRGTGGSVFAHAPFAECGGGVARAFERRVERQLRLHRVVAPKVFRGFAAVGAQQVLDVAAAGVAAGEQHVPGWRADGSAGVELRPALPLRGEAVEIGRQDFFLSVTAEFGPAEVVRENHDDVGFLNLGCDRGNDACQGDACCNYLPENGDHFGVGVFCER